LRCAAGWRRGAEMWRRLRRRHYLVPRRRVPRRPLAFLSDVRNTAPISRTAFSNPLTAKADILPWVGSAPPASETPRLEDPNAIGPHPRLTPWPEPRWNSHAWGRAHSASACMMHIHYMDCRQLSAISCRWRAQTGGVEAWGAHTRRANTRAGAHQGFSTLWGGGGAACSTSRRCDKRSRPPTRE
jgi:hypothetical protein